VKRLVTYRDEAAFRRAEDGMLSEGWRVEHAEERPYRPLSGFLDFASSVGPPPDPGTLETNIDHMRLRAHMYYAPSVTPGCMASLFGLLMLPFFLVALLLSQALRPLLGSRRYEVVWVRDDPSTRGR
jgi:hypothetical protein